MEPIYDSGAATDAAATATATTGQLPPSSLIKSPQPQPLGDEADPWGNASSSQTASSSTAYVSLTGASNKLTDIVSFVCYQSWKRRDLEKLRIPLLLFELFQLFTFAFDDRFIFSRNGGASPDNAVRAAFVLRHFRDPVASAAVPGTSCVAALCIAAALVALHVAALLFQARFVLSGNLGWRKLFVVLRLANVICPALLLPMGYMLLHPLIKVGEADIWTIAVGCLCFVLLFLDSFMSYLFCNDFRPSDSTLSMPNSRLRVGLWAAKMTLLLSDIFLASDLCSFFETYSISVAHPAIVLVTFFLLLSGQVLFLGYYSKYVNLCIAMSYTGLTLASTLIYPAWTSHTSVPWWIISLAFFFLGLLLGVPLLKVRMFVLKIRPLFIKPGLNYRYPFQCEMQTRFIYTKPSTSAQDVQKVEEIFQTGFKEFPENPYLTIMYSIFLVEKKLNYSEAIAKLNGVRRDSSTSFDIQYVRYCISTRRGESVSHEERQLDLEMARRHVRTTKKALAAFWLQLTRAKQNLNTDKLLSIVSTIHKHETAAEAIRDSPRSPQCLRNLANFLQDIKDDKEEAEVLLQLAEEYENRGKQKQTAAKPQLRFAEEPVESAAVGTEAALSPRGSTCSRRSSTSSEVSDFSSASSSPSTAERSTIMQYRQRVESTKSWPIRRMRMSLSVALLVGLVNIIVLFSLVAVSCNKLIEYTKAITYSNDAIIDLTSILDSLRLLGIEAHDVDTYRSTDQLKESLPLLINTTRTAFDQSLTSSSKTKAERAFWETGDLTIKYYLGTQVDPDPANWFEYRNETLYKATTEALAYAEDLIGFIVNNTLKADFFYTLGFRFLLDNVFQALVEPMLSLATSQRVINLSQFSRLFTQVYIFLPIALVYSVCLVLLLYLSSDYTLRKERQSTISLFRELPKTTAINMLGKVTAGDDNDFSAAHVDLGDREMSIITKLRIAFICAFGTLTTIFLLMVLIVLVFTRTQRGKDVSIDTGQTMIQRAQGMLYMSSEMIWDDTVTWPGNEINTTFAFYVEQYRYYYDQLRYSSGEIYKQNKAWDLLYYRSCPTFANSSIYCTGLESMLHIFVDNLWAFSHLPPENRTWTSEFYVIPVTVAPTLFGWCGELIDIFVEEATLTLSTSVVLFKIILGLSVPITVGFYWVFNSLLGRLNIEHTKTLKILMTLPLNIIQGTDIINRFLETGSASTGVVKAAAEEQEKKTRLLLDGSKDAVIVLNERGTIESFNPSAESLFGRATEDVLGHHASLILPDKVMRPFSVRMEMLMDPGQTVDPTNGSLPSINNTELIISHTDGKEIPVLLSVSEVVSKDAATVAMFLKDISNLKTQEAIIEEQKRRTDALLVNILPKMIKEKLEMNPEKLIAEKYKHVTVAFADIVEFTPLASKMRPWELVSMLNSLFSAWDSVIDYYHVEKIKTIGDCYMVTGGMPEESSTHAEDILELTIAMFHILGKYNAAHGKELRIRVGINTGPVVAGVIGKKKWAFDLWGDAVNFASRLESSGVPDRIQVGEKTKDFLTQRGYKFESRGPVQIKGKGEVECFLLMEPKSEQAKRPLPDLNQIFVSGSCEKWPSNTPTSLRELTNAS
ncbi:PAS domain S-box protein [Pelomyxa schiedti]|nr:PAS domain S-box protein [Pelomyxa schiedti]